MSIVENSPNSEVLEEKLKSVLEAKYASVLVTELRARKDILKSLRAKVRNVNPGVNNDTDAGGIWPLGIRILEGD